MANEKKLTCDGDGCSRPVYKVYPKINLKVCTVHEIELAEWRMTQKNEFVSASPYSN